MIPFCDQLSITTQPEYVDALASQVGPLLEDAGGERHDGGLWRFPNPLPKAKPGIATVRRDHGVTRLHLSGQVLASLRAHSLFVSLLHEVAVFPHRVTFMQLTRDDPLTDAPTFLAALYSRGISQGISLGRKRVPPEPGRVRKQMSPGHADGRETGTVYFNRRGTHETLATAYDKRNERLSVGAPDPGPLLRIEVGCTSQVRPSLRDAVECAPLFYYLAAPDLCERPAGVPDFVAMGEGFELPPRVELLPAERLKRLIEGGTFDAALRIAATLGPEGVPYLSSLLKRRLLALSPRSSEASPPPLATGTRAPDAA